MVKWPKSDLIHAEPVRLVVYDTLGDTLVWVTADSGAVDEPGNFLLAKGSVHGRSRKGMELRTDSLRWNKAQDQVSTEARVHVVSEDGDTLTGKGFVSDANLDKWQILSDVRGVFRKVDQRVQSFDAPVSSPSSSAFADSVADPDAREETGTVDTAAGGKP
jgi:LPS export ABC transporter protein LptC